MRWILGVVFGWTLGTAAARADDGACPGINDLISRISGALEVADLGLAATLTGQARTALLCQPQPLQTMLAAELSRLTGAAAYFNGDMAQATEVFGLAASISPGESLEDLYGQQAGAFYAKVRDSVTAAGGATIVLKSAGEAWIDGRSLTREVPRDLTVGRHILQTREAGGKLEARELTLVAGEDHVLTFGPAEVATAPMAAAAPGSTTASAQGRTRNTWLLGGGGALVVASGVMLALAAKSHGDFDAETDPSQLKGLQSKTNSMATAGLLTGAAGIGMIGVMLAEDGLGLGIRGRW